VPLRHRSLRFGTLHAVIVVSLAAGLLVLWAPWREAKEILTREEAALSVARSVAAAQRTFRERKVKDANGDGLPEYGTLDELRAAGLLSLDVAREPAPAHLAVGAYRIEVLLPEGLTPRDGRHALTRAGGAVDPVLASETFAVVALPGPDREGGLRALYTDSSGKTWYADEVTDPDRGTGTAPPSATLREDSPQGVLPGPVWLLAGKDGKERSPKGP
jgi:hypothetical protein